MSIVMVIMMVLMIPMNHTQSHTPTFSIWSCIRIIWWHYLLMKIHSYAKIQVTADDAVHIRHKSEVTYHKSLAL